MANAADFGDVLAADTVGKVVQERFATVRRCGREDRGGRRVAERASHT